MNEHLRDRVLRKLETLSDERGYQVLDYLEFLESKYAQRPTPPASIFSRFTEAVEDRLRAGKVSASAIAETIGLMNRAMNVLNGVATGVAAAGRSVASDFATATASRSASQPAAGGTASGGASGSASAGGAPVAASGAGTSAPSAPSPTESAGQAAAGEPGASESAELDSPLGRNRPAAGGATGEAAEPQG
jgi:hypothetical protein